MIDAHGTEMEAFSPFIQSLFDFLERINPDQMATLFDGYAKLVFRSQDENAKNEFDIFLRKHLESASEKYKQVGIVAAMSALKVLGTAVDRNASAKKPSGSLKPARGLFELILNACRSSPVRYWQTS